MSDIPRERDIIIEDPTLAVGFTVIPNPLLRRQGISPGAKLTYLMLLSYAWQDDACFPGQETLAHDLCAGVRSVRRYLQELEDAGLVTIKQRGLGLTNLYILHRLSPANLADPAGASPSSPANLADQDRPQASDQDRPDLPTTNTQTDNHTRTMDDVQTTTARDDEGNAGITQLDHFRAMTPEERLAHFEATHTRLSRMRGLAR